jgi:hypothetical protein
MQRFTKQAFVAADEEARTKLAAALACVIEERIRQSDDLFAAIDAMVAELRELGHDLWSFDESIDWATWGPDYTRPTGPGIIITFQRDAVSVGWWTRNGS